MTKNPQAPDADLSKLEPLPMEPRKLYRQACQLQTGDVVMIDHGAPVGTLARTVIRVRDNMLAPRSVNVTFKSVTGKRYVSQSANEATVPKDHRYELIR